MGLGALAVVAQDGQFVHGQGLAQLLFLFVLEGPAFLEADEHEVVPVGVVQGLPGGRDLGGGLAEPFVGLQLAALQHHQEALPGPPEFQVEGLARPETANAEAVRAIGKGEAAGSAAFWPAAIYQTAAAINAAGNKPVAIRYFILDLSPASGF